MAEIVASTPLILPALPERIYPNWLIEEISISRDAGDQLFYRGRSIFHRYRRLDDGTLDLAPAGHFAELLEPDIYGAAAEDLEMADVLERFVAVIARRARAAGKI